MATKTSTAKNKQNNFFNETKNSGFPGGSTRPWTQQHPKASAWGSWESPSPSRAGLQLSEDPSNARVTASSPGATDRWESQPARKSVLRHRGVGLQGAGWVVSTVKRYLVPVVQGECPLAAPPCWWRTQSRDPDALGVSREPRDPPPTLNW